MHRFILLILTLLLMSASDLPGQEIGQGSMEDGEWDRTRRILDCAPRLVDKRDLVEDAFDHSYVTNNPRDIEVGYFSVEPITYPEEGRRFCEALLPAAGVSSSYFRGSYLTHYQLPGEGVYLLILTSNALVFNNELRIINAQNTFGSLKASHSLEMELDTMQNKDRKPDELFLQRDAYEWELEIDRAGAWQGELVSAEMEMIDSHIPAGTSKLELIARVRGPGVVTIRESVVFKLNSISSFKYDPIFQADCLFSLEPLGVSARLLPCE